MQSGQQPTKITAFSLTTSSTLINTIMAEITKVSMPLQEQS